MWYPSTEIDLPLTRAEYFQYLRRVHKRPWLSNVSPQAIRLAMPRHSMPRLRPTYYHYLNESQGGINVDSIPQ